MSNELISSNVTGGSSGVTHAQMTQPTDILSNCLCLLKAASTNNPQYIDRLMGPFMKLLQKLYRDHLNATGASSNSLSSTSSANSNIVQVAPSSTSLEGSNFMPIGPVFPGYLLILFKHIFLLV